MPSPVNHPKHYTSHPSGIECIQVTEHMSFNIGNAVKYLWRADEKGAPIEDLQKAIWYINREIHNRNKAGSDPIIQEAERQGLKLAAKRRTLPADAMCMLPPHFTSNDPSIRRAQDPVRVTTGAFAQEFDALPWGVTEAEFRGREEAAHIAHSAGAN